ncbi:hypothetical protein BSKO_06775 [Bryopsis sp. KO-2023]|nr:hypothetical protein BSKO_06775 [Bryopsis sp. KO-2023]
MANRRSLRLEVCAGSSRAGKAQSLGTTRCCSRLHLQQAGRRTTREQAEELRPVSIGKTTGKCLKIPSDSQVDVDYPHRGSELSNGRYSKFETDEECCQFCRETPGCKLWSRFQSGVAAQFDNENNCWIKSAAPAVDSIPKPGLHTGFVEPQEVTGPCDALQSVGFRDTTIPYNDPELLRAKDAKDCCGRCKEDAPLCQGWMWKRQAGLDGDGVCFLYGNEVPASEEQLCRDCVSGRIAVDRSGLLDVEACADGGTSSVHYESDDRIVIATKNAFTTMTSKECCALCDAITLCDEEDCDIKENISGDGSDLCSTQPAAPTGDRLVVASPKECCKICQEIPECSMWTFTEGHPDQPPTACWLKHAIPNKLWKISPGGTLGSAWSGIIKKKNSDENALKFLNLVENAPYHEDDIPSIDPEVTSNGDDPNVGLIVGVVLGIIVVVIILLVVVAFFMCKKGKKRENMINVKRMEILSKGEESLPQGPLPEETQMAVANASARTDFSSANTSGEDASVNAPLLEPPEVRKYVVEPGTQAGENSFVLNTRQKFGHATQVVMKFFRNNDAFKAEVGFFSQQIVSPFIPQVFDMFDAETVKTWGLPALPCIVMERGNSTMSDWLSKQGRTIDQMDQRSILFKVCSAVQDMHRHGIVHRDLKPSNVVMFSASLSWKLIDFGSWAKKGTKAPIEYTLRYAPPEVLMEHASDATEIIAKPSLDIWSLGLIFWEVLTGDPLFGPEYSEEEVMAMLMGVEQMPYEKDPQIWNHIQLPSARRLVDNMLKKAPSSRWPIHKVMANAFFSSGADTLNLRQGQEEHTEMLKGIAEAVKRVEEKVEEATDIAMENLKHTAGNVLLCCFSFYEIDSSTFLAHSPSDSELAQAYANSTLKTTEVLLEPNYNLFKRSKEEPASLLRLDKKHLVKITLMYGGDIAMDLPITSIESVRIFPTGVEADYQDMTVFPVFHKGHLMEGVGIWETPSHKDMTLKLIGDASIDLMMTLKMKGSDRTTRVRKTVEVRMHDPEEKFKLVKTFYRTKDWYSNLPPWAKIYIHGAVTVVSLVSKRVA